MTNVQTLKVFTDGGAEGNPGPAAIGVVFEDKNGKVVFEHSESIGRATNNQAEYKAVLYALRNAKRYHPEKTVIHSDSKLIVRQLQGKYKIKNHNIKDLFLKCWNKKLDFDNLEFKFIVRSKNKKADTLVRKELSQDKLI